MSEGLTASARFHEVTLNLLTSSQPLEVARELILDRHSELVKAGFD